MACRHCKSDLKIIAKNLCGKCYFSTEIHKLYPKCSRSHRGKRWVASDIGIAPGIEPPEPTDALPGTPEKISVMAWRVRHGFRPCHPLDARAGLA